VISEVKDEKEEIKAMYLRNLAEKHQY